MPHVQVTWLEGRTVEQKRKLAERITSALVEEGNTQREAITVAFHDLPTTNYASGGILIVDKRKAT